MENKLSQKIKLIHEIQEQLEDSGRSLVPASRKAVRLAKLCGDVENEMLLQLHLDGVSAEGKAGLRVQKWADPNIKPKWDFIEAFHQDRISPEGKILASPLEQVESMAVKLEQEGARLSAKESYPAASDALKMEMDARVVISRIRNRVANFVGEVETELYQVPDHIEQAKPPNLGAALKTAVALTPIAALREAIAAVPQVKYALGVTGLAAAVAIVLGFISSIKVAVVGVLVILALMYLLAIFTQVLANIPGLKWLAGFLVWSLVILFVSTLFLVTTSYSFGKPEILSLRLFGGATHATGSEVSLGFGKPVKFEDAISILNREYNVNIFFNTLCDQSVRTATIQPNSIKGQDMRDYLQKLRERILKAEGGLVSYSVNVEGASYEIICH